MKIVNFLKDFTQLDCRFFSLRPEVMISLILFSGYQN